MKKYIFTLLVSSLPFATVCGYAHADEAAPKLQAKERPKIENELRPFDSDRDAMADVNAALSRALMSGKKAVIIIGANWCHDSRALATRLNRAEFKTLIAQNYEVVYVSAGEKSGQKNLNDEVAKRFGVNAIKGTPTVFVTRANGDVLNAESTIYWRNSHEIPADMTFAYFKHYAQK